MVSFPTSRNSLVVSLSEVRIVLFLKEAETSFSKILHSDISVLQDCKKNILKIVIINKCFMQLLLTLNYTQLLVRN